MKKHTFINLTYEFVYYDYYMFGEKNENVAEHHVSMSGITSV